MTTRFSTIYGAHRRGGIEMRYWGRQTFRDALLFTV
jgi:hypothetical protein